MKKKNLFQLFLIVLLFTLAGCSPAPKSGVADDTADGAEMGSMHEEADEAADAAEPELYEENYDRANPGTSSESYLTIDENQKKYVDEESTITFSLKVDTSSYSNVERYIEHGELPPADAVKIEEMINYFNYEQEIASLPDSPFGIYTEVGPSPFDPNKYLGLVRVKTDDINKEELPSSNLVFLIDTSGSMDSYDKLPLLQEAFGMLVETLDGDDRVSIVTYAGTSEVVLDGESGANKEVILNAIYGLMAGGSTAGADGINTAYELAEKNAMQHGNNRVILASDGDFNVGISDLDSLKSLISEKKDSGTYLSVLGFGTGNIRDDIMETLAANGNGNYSYINSSAAAEKVLVEELASNLYVVAENVKAQIEFNSEHVNNYRLIGYENRKLNNEDFTDDSVDAGEIGVGTDVVLLFEFELNASAPDTGDLFDVRIRYKAPGTSTSKEVAVPGTTNDIKEENSSDFKFASSVAAFGHLLRDSDYKGVVTLEDTTSLAKAGLSEDSEDYRIDYLLLLSKYKELR